MSDVGYVIWKAWRDGMLAQGREVPPERMAWETLSQEDRDLDAAIEAAAREGWMPEEDCRDVRPAFR